MQINWKVKNLAFRLCEAIPFGDAVYRLLQKTATRRFLPKISERTLATYRLPAEQFGALARPRVALEFGAGRGLTAPLLLSAAGAEKVYAYDLQRLASADQVDAVIAQLKRLVPGTWQAIGKLAELEPHYRIDYRAPGDARATGLADDSVDFIYSMATLEHIPPDQIRAILRESRRILRPDGRMFFTIDYHDHYASSDKSIGYMNFYQYGAREWARYNPDMHHQSRLRHLDYVCLFEDAGLAVLEKRRIFDSWAETDLKRVCLHPEFEHYSHDDLTCSSGIFLLADPAKSSISPAPERNGR